jgi:nuclease-like protein
LSLDFPIELVLALVLCLAAFITYLWTHRKLSVSAQLDFILQPLKRDEVKEIIIPDGIGGLLEIEHVVLLDQGLLLIETYSISGNLFGAEQIDEWTQIIDGRSYKFANPLRRLRTARQALKLLAPNVPIFCKVVFNADSHFPKGKPDEVSILATMADDMKIVMDSPVITTKAKQAWLRCLRIARKNGQSLRRDGEI